MLLLAVFVACTTNETPDPTPAPEPAPVDEPVAVPPTFGPLVPEGPTPGVHAAVTEVRFGDKVAKIGFQPLFETGQDYFGGVYGELVDAKGKPMKWLPGKDAGGAENRLCNVADFTSLLRAHGELFQVAHLECSVGGLSIAKLAQDEKGQLSPAAAPRLADLSSVNGGTTFCSGDVTPWNTHIAGEEYDANARLAGSDGLLVASEMDMKTKHPWEWSFLNHHADYHDDVSPYDYGWITELEITDADGASEVDKHYAMGRFSHELGLVMPDSRTVFMTDDQYHAGFFMFVADKKADLSAGTLYAARWKQKTAGGEAGLDWVSLGHATDADVGKVLLDKRPGFSDLFESADLADGACPDGFGRTTTSWGTECLKAIDPIVASRLETRRFAGLKGATTEFTKNEGLALDEAQGKMYVAMSKIDIGMLDETGKSMGPKRSDYSRTPEQDHIRMDKNSCGAVFEMIRGDAVDTEGAKIASDWVMREASPAVVGRMVEGGCAEDGISNPDNITFIEDYGLLVVAEDTSKHAYDTMWVIDLRNGGELVPLMQVDKGSEVTGIHWFSDIDGWSYLTVSNQWDDRDWPKHRTTSGVLGPFPAK